MTIRHQFVTKIPNNLEDNILYISLIYNTVIHNCCCGCGEEVVTPLSPSDWSIIYNGAFVSLHPSIGNWSFNCKSHYWIRSSNIIWAKKSSKRKIKKERLRNILMKKKYFNKINLLQIGVVQNHRGIINKIFSMIKKIIS